jgi:hypothetical protein
VATSWNYRVMVWNDDDGEPYYALHECYYEEGETEPSSWTARPVRLVGDVYEVMRREILAAFELAVVDKRDHPDAVHGVRADDL